MKIRSFPSLIASALLTLSGCAEVYQVSHMPGKHQYNHENILDQFAKAVESGRSKARVVLQYPDGGETEFEFSDKKEIRSVGINHTPCRETPDSLELHNVYHHLNGTWKLVNSNGSYVVGSNEYSCPHHIFPDSLLDLHLAALDSVTSLNEGLYIVSEK